MKMEEVQKRKEAGKGRQQALAEQCQAKVKLYRQAGVGKAVLAS